MGHYNWKGPYKLYWSNYNRYLECPQRFLWSRGWRGIDLGAGDGKPKPPPERSSDHHRLMGDVLAKVFEDLYNQELWRDPANLKEELRKRVHDEFDFRIPKYHIIYKTTPDDTSWRTSPPVRELRVTCVQNIHGYLKTMKVNRLLGTYAKSEVRLSASLGDGVPIGAKVDLILRRPETGVWILDGKNSTQVGVHTDPSQLRWYALCFYLQYGEMPQALKFIYFRYPAGTPVSEIQGIPEGVEEWNGLVDIPFDKQDLEGLAESARVVYQGMSRQDFDAKPDPKTCQFCEYERICPQRQAQKKSRSRKKSALTKKVEASESAFVSIEFE